ncbi:MAG TPA: acetylxylan esterase [Planctomycetota bacterium]|nr:acetylxylan esterase [Planctomycetota bacterium]
MMQFAVFFVLISSFTAFGGEFFKADPANMPQVKLPDVLTTSAGQKITSPEDWKKIRRPEVLELFRQHEYGRVPAIPVQTSFKVTNTDSKAMDGAATLKQIAVNVANGEKSITINVSLFVPNKRTGPVPIFLLICNRPPKNIDPTRKEKSPFWPAEEVVARGYGIAAFHNADVALDNKESFQSGAFKVLEQERKGDSWATIAAWAWGASRVMDYFETDPDIAKDKVAVLGHSRGGKTALWCGAQDERFALVISNDSGCSGAALSRRKLPEKESVARINTTFPYWFCENYKKYNDDVDALPFDQHALIALMAPRAVYVASASQDLWADPRGEFQSLIHAAPVYELFGKKGLPASEMPAIGEALHGEAMGYHIREGKHDLTLVDWQYFMDFADKLFKKK